VKHARRTRRSETALASPGLYINRDLSWIDFNERVLELAADKSFPVLERCKFLAIVSSNLDEFFMVRVAGHLDALEAGRASSGPDRTERRTILAEIARHTGLLVERQARLWRREINPELCRHGIGVLSLADQDERTLRRVKSIFTSQIFPVLTPLAAGPGQAFPYISGLSLNLAAMVSDPREGRPRIARVKATPGLARFIAVDGGVVTVEEVIRHEIRRVFSGMDVTSGVLFRVTRDGDFDISDEADDLLGEVQAHVRSRRFGDVVRLEVEAGADRVIVDTLRAHLEAEPGNVVEVPSLMDMTALWQIVARGPDSLALPVWEPRVPARLRTSDAPDMFAEIRRRDLLVHHPFDDFSTSVARFIDEAADDPDVVAIKQTIYRTSGTARIIPALIRAAEAGKSVVCLVEVQARFDEERNIRWGQALERAGAHVVYGHPGRKTHAKLVLVVRREGQRLRRYVHVGTGNYHPTTARLYTDLGLFTCRADITREVLELFNHLTGYSTRPTFRRLWVAPDDMRTRMIRQIDAVAAAHTRRSPGRITIKMNALIDEQVIQALYRASQGGVPIDLFVRGVCGLRPGIRGVSTTIRVRSVVGRFLEHTRICAFTVGDETRYFIGSADIMGRNLDNRVEVMAPVDDEHAKRELERILDDYRADTERSWELGADDTWRPLRGHEPVSDVHETLMRRAALAE
jgi:polyphosphate kinase